MPAPAYIADQLHGLVQPVDSLTPDPENARTHTDRNLDAIAASLRAFGQRKPLVAQRTDGGLVVRAGNGTLDAARRLGWEYLAVVVIDEENVTATAFALADNRTAELAEWDESALASALGVVRADWDDYDPMAMGFEEREVIKLLADHANLFDPDAGEIEQENAPGEPAEPTEPGSPGAGEIPSGDLADGTRIVQLFMPEAEHAAFLTAVRKIAAAHGDADVTSAVVRSVVETAARLED